MLSRTTRRTALVLALAAAAAPAASPTSAGADTATTTTQAQAAVYSRQDKSMITVTPVAVYSRQDKSMIPNAPAGTTLSAVQPVVRIQAPNGGFDWGDAGIGAAGGLALAILGLGGALAISEGRSRRTTT